MSWLSLIITPIITWLLSFTERGVFSFVRRIIFRRKLEKIVDENERQAVLVDEIIRQIRALKAAGKPVPPELDEELVRESSKISIGERFH